MNITKIKYKFKDTLLFALIAIFLIVLFFLSSSKQENISFNNEYAISFNESWYYLDDNGGVQYVNIPTKLDVPTNKGFNIYAQLPKNLNDNTVICIRSSLESIKLSIEDKEIYSYGDSISNEFVGSAWNIIKIPKGSAGKTICLTLSSKYQDYSVVINSIIYGSKAAVMYNIVHNYGLSFLISIIVTIVAIILLCLHIVVEPIARKKLLYLSLFSLIASFWLIGESKMLQFFLKNQRIVCTLSFVSLLILSIPIILYVREISSDSKRKLINKLLVLNIINFLVQVFLHITNLADFYETVKFSHSIIFVTIFVLIYVINYEAKIEKNVDAKDIVFPICILVFFSLLELLNFYTRRFVFFSHYFGFGVMVFIFILAFNCIKRVRLAVERGDRAEYYEELAYNDLLTRGPNRTLFNRDIEQYYNNLESLFGLRVLMFDLDYLKNINDVYGHGYGDQAIINCFNCIKNAFGSLGKCYRIGGDEFICIISRINNESFISSLDMFKKEIDKVNDNTVYNFNISMGFAVYNKNLDKDFESLIFRADKNMYENKKNTKQN